MGTATAERIDAVDTAMEKNASLRLETAEERASFLWSLKSHASDFTPEERTAYNALRDSMMRFVRAGGSIDALYTQAKIFEKYTAPKPQAEVTEEAPVAEEKPVAPEVQEKTPAVPKMMRSTSRRGPDIRLLPKEEIVVTEATSEQKETKIKIKAESQVPVEAPVAQKAEVSEVTSEELPDLASLHKEVDAINEELNAFANGTAFQWLSNPKLGYKEYMTTLIALRGDLDTKDASPETLKLLKERVEELRKMSLEVQTAVNGGSPQAPKVTSEAVPLNNAVQEEVGSQVPQAANENVPPLVAAEPEAPKTAVVSESAEPGRAVEVPVAANENAEPQQSQRVFENAAAAVFEGDGNAMPIPESAQPESIPQAPEVPQAVQEAPKPVDELNTPAINTGLHNLLTTWLGSSGFLGLGSSGENHPDWATMRELSVEDVMENLHDGVLPQGMRQETLENLAANIKAWSAKYGLATMGRSETVETFVRRVVRASMSS